MRIWLHVPLSSNSLSSFTNRYWTQKEVVDPLCKIGYSFYWRLNLSFQAACLFKHRHEDVWVAEVKLHSFLTPAKDNGILGINDSVVQGEDSRCPSRHSNTGHTDTKQECWSQHRHLGQVASCDVKHAVRRTETAGYHVTFDCWHGRLGAALCGHVGTAVRCCIVSTRLYPAQTLYKEQYQFHYFVREKILL